MTSIPVVDIGGLVAGVDDTGAGARIDAACRDNGFFLIDGHGIPAVLLDRLEAASKEFFDQPVERKAEVAMVHAGPAWRGWFPLGGELTSGVPDGKEGFYAGLDHPSDHPRVLDGTPLHGPNLFPAHPASFGKTVRDWMAAAAPVAGAVMRGVALGLGLAADWFERHLTADPTILFRVFRYPPDPAYRWGVAEHTDYGLLTLLAHDGTPGLQVRRGDRWLDVPADRQLIVCNIGDMLDRLTEGRYRSTPHRVRNTSGRPRLSFPLFFDPSWDAEVVALPLTGAPPADDTHTRWDVASPHAWEGTYGDYLTAKVSRVFPDLFTAEVGGGTRQGPEGEVRPGA